VSAAANRICCCRGEAANDAACTLPGQVQARGYFRDDNNTRREVTASGKTEAAARRALQGKVNTARDEFGGGDDVLRRDTKMAQAADVWLDWKRRQKNKGKPLAASTLRDYEGYVERSIKGSTLANLTVVQAKDVARIESWLTHIADERGETAARQSKKVLSGILGLAERRGAIPASVSPVCTHPARSRVAQATASAAMPTVTLTVASGVHT
jgi:hypothetical protein